jgi:hypothetical protein
MAPIQGKNRFVAVGNAAKPSFVDFILTSPEGINWTRRDISSALNGIKFAQDHFVAVGSAGVIVLSENGESFERATNNDSRSLRAVTYGGGRFVAVGQSGAIVTSGSVRPRFGGIDKLDNRSLALVLSSPAPAAIEISSDLMVWAPWGGGTNVSNGVLLESMTNNPPQQFYRAKLLTP